jgi:hypothetical protein
MSNAVLRRLRAAGTVVDPVFTCARAAGAVSLADKTEPRSVVMVVHDAANSGCYWVMSEADAKSLEAAGYLRLSAWTGSGWLRVQDGAKDIRAT